MVKKYWSMFAMLGMLHASPSSSQDIDVLRINEIMPCNIDQYVDPSWNYGGWVEIYNPTAKVFNLKGCWLSDNPNELKQYQITELVPIPAKSYVNLWFGHHDRCCISQIDMKLDADGGTLILSARDGTMIDKVEYPQAYPRCSWARTQNGSGKWCWTSTPTPESSNLASDWGKERLEAPVVSVDSKVFTTAFTVHVEVPEGATLRYTTDGSTPTRTNGSTSNNGTFLVSKNRIFRFVLYKDGYLTSPVVTRSYIKKDKAFSLPIVSLVTDPDHLYDPMMGVCVVGNNGRAGKGTSQECNWNMDWDRPVNFEYFSPEGKVLVNTEADLCRSGGHSKGSTPFSFKITTKKKYDGDNALNYQFFDDKPFLKYRSVLLREGGNDCIYRLKDACLQGIVRTSGIDMDQQDYQPVCHYINGVYKGTINLRETNNKYNIYSNYGLEEDEIDMYEIDCDSCYRQLCGTDEAWQQLKTLSYRADSPGVYEELKKRVDVDELCNYVAVQMYLCNNDWPQNNQKGWRPISAEGKFRFVLYDLEQAFVLGDPFSSFESRQWYTFCQLYDVPGVDCYTREVELIPIFLNMLKNDQFRKQFIDTFCLVAGSVFEQNRCDSIIRMYASRVEPMQVLNDNGYYRNNSPWPMAYELINALTHGMPTIMTDKLKRWQRMGLSMLKGQNIKMSCNIPQARLQCNGQVVPTGRFNGVLFPPVTLRASAPSGYRFVGWRVPGMTVETGGKTIIARQSPWYYYDGGSLYHETWYGSGYSTTSWKSGKAPFGYSNKDTGVKTTIGNGTCTTCYFRRTFSLSETPREGNIWKLYFSVDDGCVVYINGHEAGRKNMQSGNVSYDTCSNTEVGDNPASGSVQIKREWLKRGNNIIAVEVHNVKPDSKDMYWDASLVQYDAAEDEMALLGKEEELELPASDSKIELEAYFEKEGSMMSKPVVVNEVSASNSVFVNEYFKKNDWIELYNTTDEDIDLAGMYVSDDLDNPTKYRISNEGTSVSTLISANGYRIIWCDKQQMESQLHAPFKLANQDNACVILTAPDCSWSDTLIYCAHDGMESVGRFPDGGKMVYKMYNPTISSSNLMDSYSTAWRGDTIQSGVANEQMMTHHSGGMSIVLGQDALCVKDEDCEWVELDVFTIDGKMAMSRKVYLQGGKNNVDISLLKEGMYVARMRNETGDVCSTKFKR